MHRRKLEELNLLDDFLFNKMVSHPEFGEEFSRELLRIILGKKVGKLEVVPQKIYYGSNTDKHGTRLDVYLDETEENTLENATVYDVEPEGEGKEENIKTLARRVRFYHSKIDAGSFKSGQDYRKLKNVVVIFIMPKDPIGANRMLYTIENKCKELPDLPYEDNAKNDTLKKIHQMIKRVKSDEEVSLEYMKIFEREQMLKEQGHEEGHREGRREEAKENARKLFENGVSYELVRNSIKTLSDEELQKIYDEVK